LILNLNENLILPFESLRGFIWKLPSTNPARVPRAGGRGDNH